MDKNTPIPVKPEHLDRWRLLADLAAFQGKLVVDGLRDVFLSPLSIGATLLDLVKSENRDESHFYKLMKLGKDSDEWIALFSAARKEQSQDQNNIDAIVGRIEKIIVEQHQQDGLTRQAAQRLEKALDKLKRTKQAKGKVSEQAQQEDLAS